MTRIMDIEQMREIVGLCSFYNYNFTVKEGHGGIHLQGFYEDTDIATGKASWQFTRKWLLSPYMTRSEIVQTVFKLCLTSFEHRTREGFKYKGKRVFGPHFDVEELVILCQDKGFDFRVEDPHKDDHE